MTTSRDLDRSIARLLIVGTYLSVGLLAIGVALMVVRGIPPLGPVPPFEPSQIPAEIAGSSRSGSCGSG